MTAAELAQQLWQVESNNNESSAWSIDKITNELASPLSKQYLSYLVPGQISAFVLYRIIDNEAWIMNIAVNKKGIGEGARLMANFITSLDSEIEQIGLEVKESNLAARALYKKFNFLEIGRRNAYYANGESALVLRLKK